MACTYSINQPQIFCLNCSQLRCLELRLLNCFRSRSEPAEPGHFNPDEQLHPGAGRPRVSCFGQGIDSRDTFYMREVSYHKSDPSNLPFKQH